MALERNRLGQGGRQDFGRIAPFDILEQGFDQMEMAQLIVQEALPDGAHLLVGFLLQAAVVVVDLIRFVHQPLLQPALGRIDQG